MQRSSNDEGELSPETSAVESALSASELQHRFRNNLQLIISVLGLQADRTAQREVSDMLGQMQNRIRVIAHMYSGLHASDGGSITVHFGEYLTRLAGELSSFHELGQRVRIQVSAADLALSVDEALPLALIANELVSNAFRHAFPENCTGEITVALQYLTQAVGDGTAKSRGELLVNDDGIGLPPDVAFATADSLGFHLVRTLARQVDAKIDVKSQGGTSVRVSFPLAKEDWG